MRILAIDTSTEQLSLALWQDGATLDHACPAGQQHSSLTVPLIQQLLAEAGCSPQQLDAIAYPVGPGSFTGLRIGCGVAQGLGYALDKPLIGLSTLATLAASVDANQVLACLDARMNQLYAGRYRRTATGWENVLPDGLYNPEQLPLPEEDGWHGVGNGFAAQPGLQARAPQLQVVDAQRLPHARELAQLAAAAFQRGEAVPASEAGLVYLRDKVALTTREREKA